MKQGISIILGLFLLMAGDICAQSGTSVDRMQEQKAEIERQIAASKKLLTSTDNDIQSQLVNLNLLTRRLEERRKLLEQTRQEISSLDKQSKQLSDELRKLQDEYEACRQRYADACRFYQKQKTSFNALLFLLSSQNYTQLSRRFRYVREYSKSISELAVEIAARQVAVQAKQDEIESLRQEKLALQEEQAAQKAEAEKEARSQRFIVSKLQSKRSSLKKEIDRKQKEMNTLNKEIERQIALALAEEKKKRNNGSSAQSGPTAAARSDTDVKLSGNFESNKGKLPVPITGTYLIVSNFGVQNVAGMKNVKMNNLGIDIQGEKGAQAKAVFDGTVTTVFQQGKGQIGVLVRHGSYISVYCNLCATRVAKGDNVKTGDIIGDIAQDADGRTILHFQLHKESTKLNPSDWLR